MYYKRKYIKIFCLFNKIYFDHFFLKILFLKKIKNDYLGKCADFSKRKVYRQHTRYLFFIRLDQISIIMMHDYKIIFSKIMLIDFSTHWMKIF